MDRLRDRATPATDLGSYDAVVVGARCAGAATALLLAREGLRVLVLERGDRGGDTLSTHALMRGGVLLLDRWGVLPVVVASGTPPVTRTIFRYGDEAEVVDIAPRAGVGALYAPRRTVLDRLLVAAAEEAGADVRFGVRVDGVIRNASGAVAGVSARERTGRTHEIDARLVVGADGVRSRIAQVVGAPLVWRGSRSSSMIYGYFSEVAVDGYEWSYNPGVGSGVIPTNDGQVCVWAGAPTARFLGELRGDLHEGFHRVLAEASRDVAARVASGRQHGHLRGWPGIAGFTRAVAGPGWALVGDAAGFLDPLSTHGITDAFRDAALLARSARSLAGDPDARQEALRTYEVERDRLARPIAAATDEIAGFGWRLAELRGLLLSLAEGMRAEMGALLALEHEAVAA